MVENMKTIGVKANIKDDKLIDLRAKQQGTTKSELYRKIIDDYFVAHPLTGAEEELVKLIV
jgi:hypothetical protein